MWVLGVYHEISSLKTTFCLYSKRNLILWVGTVAKAWNDGLQVGNDVRILGHVEPRLFFCHFEKIHDDSRRFSGLWRLWGVVAIQDDAELVTSIAAWDNGYFRTYTLQNSYSMCNPTILGVCYRHMSVRVGSHVSRPHQAVQGPQAVARIGAGLVNYGQILD